MNKKELRKKINEIRSNQNIDDFNKNNEIIINKVINYLNEHNYKNILIYMDMNMEVAASLLIDKGFNIYITKTMPNNTLNVNKYNDKTLVLHEFGYYECSSSDYIDPSIIDVALVPGLAFDTNGNRLGYGKGYYDRFLACYSHIKRIAIAFDFQIVENIPTDEFDQTMDMIITNKRMLTFVR